MDAPRIQYAKTSDGVNIAYWTLGQGTPLVVMPRMPWSHIQLEWQRPDPRLYYERLAEQRMLVRYDGRGVGLSDRDAMDFSLDSQLLDLEAVVDRIGLTRFALYGVVYSGLAAIAYAQRHPEKASRLLLWCAAARGADITRHPQFRALTTLADQDWDLFTESITHYVFGYSDAVRAHEAAEFLRECASQEAYQAWDDAASETDVSALLPHVKSPTLVLHRRHALYPQLASARELASQIPNARLALLEGASHQPYVGDVHAVLAAIDDFLREGEPADVKTDLPSGTAVILFADIADSTALTESLGDAAFRAKARELGPSLRALIRECAGQPVEGPTLGDGVLAVFKSAREAIEAALACARAGDEAGLPLHLGLHAGDVTPEKDPDGRDNVYGGAVNIASRVSGLSAPGEVLVSETVRSLARTSAGVRFEDQGRHRLKGVGETVRVWAVVEGE